MKSKLGNAHNEKRRREYFSEMNYQRLRIQVLLVLMELMVFFKCGNIRTLLEFKYSCDLKE